ncbi:hypothetical protein GOODEAATRI_027926, partial [Goodea atripinnis]
VVVPTRVGQVYVYDPVKADKGEYDFPPRHQLPAQQDIYDVPPTRQQYSTQVYDFPPSVSKDVPDGQLIREETYDVPPHFAKLRHQVPIAHGQYQHNISDDDEPPIPEDVYDVPPPILTEKHHQGERGAVRQATQEIYDIPAALRGGGLPSQDVYDFPREREDRGGERGDQYVYDVPPQVVPLHNFVCNKR